MKVFIVKALRFVIGCAVIGGALAVAYFFGPALLGHGKGHKDEQARPIVAVPVTLAPVIKRSVERRVGVVGTLEGFEEVAISTKVEGRVLRVYHDIGDRVAPGEPLADIDPTDYQLALNEAKRSLEFELAKLGLKELCSKDKLDVAQVPMVMRAHNLESNARTVLERARRLATKRVIGTEELEKAQTEARVASANRIQAEFDARTALASAIMRNAQVASAQQKLIDARILVPTPSPSRLPPGVDPKAIRYVVASRKVAEGEICRVFPSGTIFRLVIDQPLKLVAQVPERFIGEVKLNQSVTLTTEAYPDQKFVGTLTRLNPTVDRASRSFTVEITVPNQDRKLRAGSFVKASILTRASESVPTVPEEAVVRFAGVVKVFVVKGDRSLTVPVRTGEVITVTEGNRQRRWVEVIGQLPGGAQVAVTGMSQLADNTLVRLKDARDQAGPAAVTKRGS